MEWFQRLYRVGPVPAVTNCGECWNYDGQAGGKSISRSNRHNLPQFWFGYVFGFPGVRVGAHNDVRTG